MGGGARLQLALWKCLSEGVTCLMDYLGHPWQPDHLPPDGYHLSAFPSQCVGTRRTALYQEVLDTPQELVLWRCFCLYSPCDAPKFFKGLMDVRACRMSGCRFDGNLAGLWHIGPSGCNCSCLATPSPGSVPAWRLVDLHSPWEQQVHA